MRDAISAFENIDINSDGFIDISEAEKLVQESSSMNDSAGSAKARIEAFFKSFDVNGDRKISKAEWLTFYGNLFDNIFQNGLIDHPNANHQ